jgi:hypothetical protein
MSLERLEEWGTVIRSWHPAFYDFASAYLYGCKGTTTLTEAMARIRAEYERQGMGFDYPNPEDEHAIVERLLYLSLLRAALRQLACYMNEDGVTGVSDTPINEEPPSAACEEMETHA